MITPTMSIKHAETLTMSIKHDNPAMSIKHADPYYVIY